MTATTKETPGGNPGLTSNPSEKEMNMTTVTATTDNRPTMFAPGIDFDDLRYLDSLTVALADMPDPTNVHEMDRVTLNGRGAFNGNWNVELIGSDTVDLRRWADLPCAIEWCEGHQTIEADNWGELQHRAPSVVLYDLPFLSSGGRDKYGDATALVNSDGKSLVHVSLDLSHEVTPADARRIAAEFVGMSERLLQVAEQAEQIAAVI